MSGPALVRRGEAGDTPAFLGMMEASGRVLSSIFGPRTGALLGRLYQLPDTVFSADLTFVAEVAGGSAGGMLLGYSAATAARRGEETRRRIKEFLGLEYYVRAPRLVTVHRALGGPAAGDYLLAHLAVEPEVRRGGVGARLVASAADDARRNGCFRIVLDLAEGNTAAGAFYARLGFREVARPPDFRLGGERFSFLRLELPLGGGEESRA